MSHLCFYCIIHKHCTEMCVYCIEMYILYILYIEYIYTLHAHMSASGIVILYR
jgi:hypothetical protein